jgi:hypothetical protein
MAEVILKSTTPCPSRTYIVPNYIYPIELRGKVVGMVSTELVVTLSFDGLPPGKYSVRRRPNRILLVKRGDGVGVVLIECRVKIGSESTNLLG